MVSCNSSLNLQHCVELKVFVANSPYNINSRMNMVCIERNLILRIYTFYIKQSVGARAFVTFLSLYVK